MGFIQDFKDFAFKGNLIDMAVGIVMGTAVGAIVKSFLDNIVTPLISMLFKVPDMSGLKYEIGEKIVKKGADGKALLDEAGNEITEMAAIHYGTFIQNVLDFVILAFVIFIALKIAARWMKKAEQDAGPSEEVQLLTEIRDSLKK